MGLRTVWLWPLHPLLKRIERNLQREVSQPDGAVVTITSKAKDKYPTLGLNSVTANNRAKFYVPTAEDLAVIEQALPGTEAANPSWSRIGTLLERAGVEGVRSKSARELIALLREHSSIRSVAHAVEDVVGKEQSALRELRTLWHEGYLELVYMGQRVDGRGQLIGVPKVTQCEPLKNQWPDERLTRLWRETAGVIDPDALQLDEADYGLSAFLWSRSQRLFRPTRCDVTVLDPLAIWVDAIHYAGREPQTVFLSTMLIEPDPRKAGQLDLASVAERARHAARDFQTARDEYPRRIQDLMDAQREVGQCLKEHATVPPLVRNQKVIALDNLLQTKRKLYRLTNDVELAMIYARALLPNDVASCLELNSNRWAGFGERADCLKLATELNLLASKLEWMPPPQIQSLTDGPKKPSRRKRKRAATKRPLTAKQTEAMMLLGESGGNIAEVGRRMGVDRKTAKQHLDVGFEKLGTSALKPGKTMSLPTDKRGQESVNEESDKRR